MTNLMERLSRFAAAHEKEIDDFETEAIRERRDALVAQVRELDAAHAKASPPLTKAVETAKAEYDAAHSRAEELKAAFFHARGELDSEKLTASKQRGRLQQELREAVPHALNDAIAEARERRRAMANHEVPAGFDVHEALRASEILHSLGAQALTLAELNAEIEALLSKIPAFEAERAGR